MYLPDEIEKYLLALLPALGVNKLRELTRLVYEICKRENADPQAVVLAQKI